jgi:DNA mismatch repair protein MSH3
MNDEYVIEVNKSAYKKAPDDWIPLKGTKTLDRYHTPFIKEKLQHLQEAREMLVLESDAAWAHVLRDFSAQYAELRQAVVALATLDCLFSLAVVAKQEGYVRPTILPSASSTATQQQLKIVGGRHPVVEALLPEPFVPNDVCMETQRHSVYILTGPNMGGKTSFARQVALISVMAQIGSFVPAQEASLTPFDAIYTRMGASDDDTRGHSTFFVELQETSEILRHASPRSLVLLDELGRGTSTHDGYAIAYATLQYIISRLHCLTLFVTHYPALAHLERLHPVIVQNFHMGFLLRDSPSTPNRNDMGRRDEHDPDAQTATAPPPPVCVPTAPLQLFCFVLAESVSYEDAFCCSSQNHILVQVGEGCRATQLRTERGTAGEFACGTA